MGSAGGTGTRQRILETALQLFSNSGYDKVSVRDIAQAAEVNVAALEGALLVCVTPHESERVRARV